MDERIENAINKIAVAELNEEFEIIYMSTPEKFRMQLDPNKFNELFPQLYDAIDMRAEELDADYFIFDMRTHNLKLTFTKEDIPPGDGDYHKSDNNEPSNSTTASNTGFNSQREKY